MAIGKTKSVTVVVNNMPSVTVTKTVELVVKGGILVPEDNDTNPGVRLG